jgi:hypothetical protein
MLLCQYDSILARGNRRGDAPAIAKVKIYKCLRSDEICERVLWRRSDHEAPTPLRDRVAAPAIARTSEQQSSRDCR